MSERISKAARDFISRHIHSVAQLEVLLYARSRPGEKLTPETVARDEKIAVEMARDLLVDLARRGLLEQASGPFVYKPNEKLAQQIDELASAYGTFRVAIISLIFSRPSEGIRNFGDAFRVRKDEE